MAIELVRHRFTVADFQRMGEAGILGEDDRVELIDGEIVEMTPIGSRHAACVDRQAQLFFEQVGRRAHRPGPEPHPVGGTLRASA